MYGTVARMRLRPQMESRLREEMQGQMQEGVPGWVASYVYRSDADPDEVFAVILFESREAYWANARSQEQDRRYRRMRDLLQADPEWHDGEIVQAQTASGAATAG
jgi:heme-degrading monooxygenase HmoA